MGFHSKYKRPGKRSQQEEPFLVAAKTYLSPMTLARVKDQCLNHGLSLSRLIAIAIDNELDTKVPFTYETDFIPELYQEYMYVQEASTLLDFICKFPSGLGRDLILLCRRDLAMDKDTILRALRELMEKGMVEEIIPTNTRVMHRGDYRVIRAMDIQLKERKVRKYKSVEGESTKGQRRIKDDEVSR